MSNPYESPSTRPTRIQDTKKTAPETTDWKGLGTLVGLVVVGAVVGAFVYAPWRWDQDPYFIGRQWGAAALGALLALFPGSLILVVVEAVVGRFRGKDSE